MTVPVALGLRGQRGGGVLAAVALEGSEPRLARSSFLATATEGDRLSFEPYHVAVEVSREAEGEKKARAAVAAGRKRQDALAVAALSHAIRELRDAGYEPVIAALLVNRAGWINDLLRYSLAYDDHPPVAEGLAVRDALRHAVAQAGLAIAEVDEKSLPAHAIETLGLAQHEIESRLRKLGATERPWRKEQKTTTLAAWTTLAATIPRTRKVSKRSLKPP